MITISLVDLFLFFFALYVIISWRKLHDFFYERGLCSFNTLTLRRLSKEKRSFIASFFRDTTEQERRTIACHEAGHAYVMYKLGIHIHLATVAWVHDIGRVRGNVVYTVSATRSEVINILAVKEAGGIAERLLLKTDWVGLHALQDRREAFDLAEDFACANAFPPSEIQECKDKLLDAGYTLALKILSQDLERLRNLADFLAKYRYVSGSEIHAFLKNLTSNA